ncbi:MAG: hypothetical protein RBS53_11615 [Bacteroidales bacterium]|jgi:hypothetical protein|nr:hypothetical protein [Bacteroidales bacterium]NLM93391.1 hypothetical protein [Bacteroidales bacterium]
MKLNKMIWGLGLILVFPTFPVNAQQALRGTITQWEKGEGKIAFYDMFTGEFSELGRVGADGSFEIGLAEDYPEQVRRLAAKALDNAPAGWSLQKNTLASSFRCGSEDLVYTRAEAEVMGLPELSLTNETGGPLNGVLVAASSREVADWLFTYGGKKPEQGYYLRWYYAGDKASVKGKCITDVYTGNGEEFFTEEIIMDLELVKGWNIVKTEISRVFTDEGGRGHPARYITTSIPQLPEGLGWFALENEY